MRQLRWKQLSFILFNRGTIGGYLSGRHEYDQVLFVVLLDIGAKGPADERNVAKNWDFILSFLNVFAVK